jgi:hypothetical protein
MTFKTSWTEGDKRIVIELRFQPMPIWISHEEMSIIVEIRDAKTRKALEVWHLRMRFDDASITHRDRKYP